MSFVEQKRGHGTRLHTTYITLYIYICTVKYKGNRYGPSGCIVATQSYELARHFGIGVHVLFNIGAVSVTNAKTLQEVITE